MFVEKYKLFGLLFRFKFYKDNIWVSRPKNELYLNAGRLLAHNIKATVLRSTERGACIIEILTHKDI